MGLRGFDSECFVQVISCAFVCWVLVVDFGCLGCMVGLFIVVGLRCSRLL